MAFDIETESQITDQDLTSEVSLGEYTNSSGATLFIGSEIRLSKLNGAAGATFTLGYRKKTSGDAEIYTTRWSESKDAAADTVYGVDLLPIIRLANGEKLEWRVKSSNSNDDNGGGAGTGPDVDITWFSDQVDVIALAQGTYKIADTTGNWGTNGTWSDNVQPAAGDNIIIRDGVTVTVAASLDLGQFGTFEAQGTGLLNIAVSQTVAVVPRGWVVSNNAGIVSSMRGQVTVNSGTITTNNNGLCVFNNGTIGTNNEHVTTNTATGTITNNTGIVAYNVGTVTTNGPTGVVLHNYGTIGTDNGNSDVPTVTTVTDGAKAAALATVDGNVDSILEIIQ